MRYSKKSHILYKPPFSREEIMDMYKWILEYGYLPEEGTYGKILIKASSLAKIKCMTRNIKVKVINKDE